MKSLFTYLLVLSSGAFSKVTKVPKVISNKTIKSILDRGVLRIGMHKTDQPPFFMTDKNGELIGFSVEIAKGMGERLGVPVVFDRSSDSFDDVVDMVASGKVDIGISKLSFTLKRALKVLYNEPHAVLQKSLMVNRLERAKLSKKLPKPHTLSKTFAIKGASIGVIANSSYVSFAKILFPKVKVVSFKTWGEAIEAVKKGKITAIIRDNLEMAKILKKDSSLNLTLQQVDIAGENDPIYSITHHKNSFLRHWVNGFLKTVVVKKETAKGLLSRYKDYFSS